MAQPGAFVPAWKRLGLKLKKFEETESNHQVDELQNGQSSAQNGSALRENHNLSQSTKNNNSRLGKRKHHSDTAGIQGGSVKKSKYDRGNDHPDGHPVPAPNVELQSLEPAAAGEASPADKATPKGDPNYRKKNGGDPNYRKKKEPEHAKKSQKTSHTHVVGAQSQRQTKQNLTTPKNVRTPSLSPGQTELATDRSTLLPSTGTDHSAPKTLATPQRRQGNVSKDSSSSLSPPKTDRRKSVTFTPDTKTSDGSSASNLFKKWVAEQKGSSVDTTPAEAAQFTEPPKIHVANSNPPSITQTSKVATAAKGKKKDPSRYLNYLTQYHQDRANWKFNKAIQNDVLENSLNIFRIPEDYSDALLEYVSGLKGAGVIERLQERCTNLIHEIDEAESKDPMDEREAMKEAALQDRLSKERRRRRLEGDLENMVDHPYSEGYIRRLKRNRAEALCSALKIAMPAATTPQSGLRQTAQQKPSEVARPIAQTNARKRAAKRRTDISSDESSDSSSSDEESSSEDISEDDSSSAPNSNNDEEDGDSSDTESETDSSDESDDTSANEDDSD